MKIGIVTVYDSSNCGSFLQAFALKACLEENGHDVFFARFRSREELKNIYYTKSLLIKSVIKYPIIGVKRYLFAKNKFKVFNEEIDKYFKCISVDRLSEMDAVILGSDEIWNVNSKTFTNPLFYGEGLNNAAAYAVSVGNADLQSIEKFPRLVEAIKQLPSVLVRDQHTQAVVENILKKPVDCVCDPTFLLNREKYESIAVKNTVNKKYILLYSYSLEPWMKKYVKRFAKENKMQVVSVGFFHIWADKNINCSPLEIYSLMKNAEFVITTTFHGSVFSILSRSRFVVYPGGSKNKIYDLLLRMGLQDHMINESVSYETFKDILYTDVDYEPVSSIIVNYRALSKSMLEKSITNLSEEKQNDKIS